MDVLFISPKQTNKQKTKKVQYVIILLRAIIYLSQLKTFKLQINKRFDSKPKAIKNPSLTEKECNFSRICTLSTKLKKSSNLYNVL